MTIIRKTPEEIVRSTKIESTKMEKTAHQPQHTTPQSAQTESASSERALFWSRFVGQRLTFHLKGGTVVEGSFTEEEHGYLRVEDAVVTGSNHRVRSFWIMLEASTVLHFHPASAEVERFKR